jgi:hypothetical protein
MATTIIEGVRQYIANCPLLSEIPVSKKAIDWTDESNPNYGIVPDGDSLLRGFISGGGNGKRQYAFAVFVRNFTTTAVENLSNAEFIERLQQWCDTQTKIKYFPEMPLGCSPTKITADNGFLFELDKNGRSGLYQIQFKLIYNRR